MEIWGLLYEAGFGVSQVDAEHCRGNLWCTPNLLWSSSCLSVSRHEHNRKMSGGFRYGLLLQSTQEAAHDKLIQLKKSCFCFCSQMDIFLFYVFGNSFSSGDIFIYFLNSVLNPSCAGNSINTPTYSLGHLPALYLSAGLAGNILKNILSN